MNKRILAILVLLVSLTSLGNAQNDSLRAMLAMRLF